MKNKVCLITGGTAGIGKATAIELARKGAHVFITARNQEKGKTACDEIKKITGNKQVEYLTADFASLESVKALADACKSKLKRLDVLINNAGVFHTERTLSHDGYEMQFAVNHLAHFLLTNLLLDIIRQSAPARIINVSSRVHRRGNIYFDDLQLAKGGYDGFKAYGQSKLANILFTYELAERLKGTGITVNCLHPGGVATNFAFNHSSGLYRWVWTLVSLFLTTVQEGAKTSVYLAASPEVESLTGKYFAKSKPANSSAISHDKEVAKKLWKVSEELTGIRF